MASPGDELKLGSRRTPSPPKLALANVLPKQWKASQTTHITDLEGAGSTWNVGGAPGMWVEHLAQIPDLEWGWGKHLAQMSLGSFTETSM